MIEIVCMTISTLVLLLFGTNSLPFTHQILNKLLIQYPPLGRTIEFTPPDRNSLLMLAHHTGPLSRILNLQEEPGILLMKPDNEVIDLGHYPPWTTGWHRNELE
jgi:hypothetical protein